ncbi:MAG: AsnC family transcriptional regulator [Lachnospiraceae bacterium]|nr:AsnC family transcriptional regulator [Lachnospiraceae bacterium]
MDEKDKKILDMIEYDARKSYREIGEELGISRVAAKKRIAKLERTGVIRQYNTYIKREGEITVMIDIITSPDGFDRVLEYLFTRTMYIKQICTTLDEYHIHAIAVSDSPEDLIYMIKIIKKACSKDIEKYHCTQVREIIKDVYGGIDYKEK